MLKFQPAKVPRCFRLDRPLDVAVQDHADRLSVQYGVTVTWSEAARQLLAEAVARVDRDGAGRGGPL